MSDTQNAYSDFISAAMQFLVARPDSQVLIIVEGPKGFETYRTGSGMAWPLGALAMAGMVFARMLQENRNPEIERKTNEEEMRKIDAIVKMGKDKPN